MLICVFLLFFQGVYSVPFVIVPEAQEQNERQFKNGELQQIDVITPDSLYNAGIVKTYQNNIYVLDYGPVPGILKIDPESHSIMTRFGKRRGRGPGELLNPTDFDISGDGSIWIADHPSSRIVIFSPDGAYETEWVIKHIPYKIAMTENDLILIYSSSDPVIKLVDSSKNIIWNSEPIVENPMRWARATAGFVLSRGDKSALFVSNYAGIMVLFDEKGLVQFIRRTINYEQQIIGGPIPGLDYLAYRVDRTGLKYAIADGFIKDENLYLLVQFYGDNRYQVIDVYSVRDGSYLYSYRLPASVRAISYLAPNTLVGLKSDRLVLWSLGN